MKYVIPQLHSLSGRKTRGNCANGSSAGSASDTCTTGTGINNSGSYCLSGAGDATRCINGTAAYTTGFGAYCTTGTAPNDTCETGGGPAS